MQIPNGLRRTFVCTAGGIDLETRLLKLSQRAQRAVNEKTTTSSLVALAEVVLGRIECVTIPWDVSVLELTVHSIGMVTLSAFPTRLYGNLAAMHKHHITIVGYHFVGSQNPVINLLSAYDYGDTAHVAESEAPGLLAAVIKRYCEACRGDTESPA